jgi:uncharacterized membrane protein
MTTPGYPYAAHYRAPVQPPPLPSNEPSGEDRMIAAAAHLAFLGGLWLVGPIVIYLWKRKTSPFVAVHAVQATLVSGLFLAMGMLAAVLALPGSLLLSLLVNSREAATVMSVAYLAAVLLALSPLVLVIGGTVMALRGKVCAMPIIGKLAQRLLSTSSGSA